MTEQPRNGDPGDIPHDEGVARAYRDAAREAPPPQLDAVILAAARREAQARPRAVDQGELASGEARGAPAPRRRWHVPLALAAVLVLSVSIVTLHREEPQLPPPVPQPGEPLAAPELRDAPAPSVQPRPPASARKPVPETPREAVRPEPSPRAEAESREDAALGAAASKAEEASGEARQLFRGPQAVPAPRRGAGQAAPAAPAAALAADEPPEKWGERIMALRQDGKSDEADALLAEFRKRYPGHPVPEAWLR